MPGVQASSFWWAISNERCRGQSVTNGVNGKANAIVARVLCLQPRVKLHFALCCPLETQSQGHTTTINNAERRVD